MDGGRDTAVVREQLSRLVSHPLLKSSRRCRSFLQFVVEEALEGRGAALKERTVGVAVFGRNVEYDTSLDHIVRNAATDLRRRLAQYYQDPDRVDELRISLPQGTYTPTFQLPTAPAGAPTDFPAAPVAQTAPVTQKMPFAHSMGKLPLYFMAALLAFTAIGIVTARIRPRHPAAIGFIMLRYDHEQRY